MQLSNKEVRAEAWRAIWDGRWFGRLAGTLALLAGIYLLVASGLQLGFSLCGITGLEKYASECALAMKAGLARPLLEGHEALRMTGAWIFVKFISYVFSGIVTFGSVCAFLKCARGDGERLLADVFVGATRPFGVMWLALLAQIRIFLWSLLFVVPGVIAWYRYRAAWFVKVDHPCWSASRCLAESGRLMKGRKWRLFALDCSYWKSSLFFFVPLLLLSGLAALSTGPVAGFNLGAVVFASFVVMVAGLLVFIVHFGVGLAIFYREILRDEGLKLDSLT